MAALGAARRATNVEVKKDNACELRNTDLCSSVWTPHTPSAAQCMSHLILCRELRCCCHCAPQQRRASHRTSGRRTSASASAQCLLLRASAGAVCAGIGVGGQHDPELGRPLPQGGRFHAAELALEPIPTLPRMFFVVPPPLSHGDWGSWRGLRYQVSRSTGPVQWTVGPVLFHNTNDFTHHAFSSGLADRGDSMERLLIAVY
jgi:hypothetical protein